VFIFISPTSINGFSTTGSPGAVIATAGFLITIC
jgi:hypothetical protein